MLSMCLQVAGIFHDASIGNAIHVILVRLILLQGEEVTLTWDKPFMEFLCFCFGSANLSCIKNKFKKAHAHL